MTAFRLEGVGAFGRASQSGAGEAAAPFGTLGTLERSGLARVCGARSATSRRSPRAGPPASAMSGAFRRRRRAAPMSAARSSSAAEAEILYDWAGGLVWAALPPSDDAGAARVRSTVAASRRPRDADPRAGRGARRGRRVRAGAAGACRIDQARAGELRSARRPQCRAHVGGRVTDADLLHPRAAGRSGHRRVGKDSARLRALRLLHRDLPDLRARRQRARFAARAHLPDQGHAGERPAGDGGGRRCISIAACRASPA